MNATLAATMGLLVAVFNVWSTGAQETLRGSLSSTAKTAGQDVFQLCATNDQTDAAEQAKLKTYTPPALEKALLSTKAFWAFITDPSTPYLDRMAAANRGGSVLSPEELPLLWQAMAEIAMPTGVAAPPCSAVAVIFLPPTASTRVVLGREIQSPTKSIDFPVTAEERDRSPWLWQMERALSTLFANVNRYYGDPSRYPLRVQAAWDWSIPISAYRPGEVVPTLTPAEWERIRLRSQALTESAPHDVLLLQTIVKLALNNDNYYVAYSSHIDDLYAWGQDSFHYEELTHAAQIAILQKTRWEDVAARTAFVTAQLAQYKRDPMNVPHIVPLQTATSILAIGRWATDKSLNPWNRYYSFVNPICRIVDDPPFPPDQLRDPKEPRLEETLNTFDAWFEQKRSALQQQDATEKPHLQALAKELSTDIE